ncbi:MAG: hypothetical protein ACRD0C_08820 [Acidimicrobiia bacterium]
MDDGIPPFLTVAEAGRLLRIGRTKAYELTREWRVTGGRSGLPVVDLGDVLRVPGPAIERMLVTGVTPTDGACPRKPNVVDGPVPAVSSTDTPPATTPDGAQPGSDGTAAAGTEVETTWAGLAQPLPTPRRHRRPQPADQLTLFPSAPNPEPPRTHAHDEPNPQPRTPNNPDPSTETS